MLIALALTGSAGAASAAATASLGSSLGYMAEMVMACVSGNVPACMAASGGAGTVIPDVDGNPTVKNK
ncbi:MAG TPA: hypothetical protein VJ833_09090 [Rhodanobacteraceae bacterium]|nr:hypothetical protein [Rhodanobacteraceae bacterium]